MDVQINEILNIEVFKQRSKYDAHHWASGSYGICLVGQHPFWNTEVMDRKLQTVEFCYFKLQRC